MSNKTLFVSLLLATGCGTTTPYSYPGDGSDMGSGSGSDVSDPPGSHPPGQIYGHVKDERGDTIDFSSGEPVHTHAGAAIDLSSGCPAVYHYAYLNNKSEPKYGRQVTTNPLEFKITTDVASLDPSASAYRVRTEDNHLLLDWTPMSADADGVYAMALHRDDSPTMAVLGTDVGKMFVDARFRDTSGTETVNTGCFENHPLSAPLNVSAPVAGELFGLTLAANSPISHVIESAGAIVTSSAIVQQTAEPIAITIHNAAPTGTGSETSAEMWLATGTDNVQDGTCDEVNFNGVFVDCSPPPITTIYGTRSGPLNGVSMLEVVDDVTSAIVCSSQQGADLACTIPARTATEAPHGYHLILGRASETSLDHPNDNSGLREIVIATKTYTAEQLANVSRCTQKHAHVNPHTGENVIACTTSTTYAHIIAVDKARIDFDVMTMTISASTGAATPELVPYLSASVLTFPAKTWDAGDAGL